MGAVPDLGGAMRIATVLALAAAALMMALPAYADPPVVHYAHEVFVDVNPCTGLEHTVTIDSTIYEPVNGVSRSVSTITTSSGFSGTSAAEISVFHEAFSILNDVLYNPATGQRIHAHVVVIDDHVADASFTCIPEGEPS
jgi:hypothetical protein